MAMVCRAYAGQILLRLDNCTCTNEVRCADSASDGFTACAAIATLDQ